MSSAKISSVELIVCTSFWTGTIFYSMYRFQATSQEILVSLNGTVRGLEPGWDWIGRKLDVADADYSIFAPLLLNWLLFVTLHLIVNQLMFKRFPRFVRIFSVALSFAWLYNCIGLRLSLLLFLQPLIMFNLFKYASFISCWIYFLSSFVALLSGQSLCVSFRNLLYGDSSYIDIFAFTVIFSWTQCRLLSFVYDTRKKSLPFSQWIENVYHFCFYLPLLPCGPLVLYNQFQDSMEKAKNRSWNGCRFLLDLLQVLRYSFWGFFFHKFALHYFYHSCLTVYYMHELGDKLDIWSAAGLTLTLGIFFTMKYRLFYGLPSALARMDGMDAPGAPTCTMRIQLYSQMWRQFDRGLYNFLRNYIFLPFVKSDIGNIVEKVCGRLVSKMIGSALCFSFVFIIHGATRPVMWWCLSNFIGIVLETTGTYLSNNPSPLATCKANWTEANWLRLVAAAGAPLQFSSILFIAGFATNSTHYVSIITDKCFFQAGVFGVSWILAAFYSCGHVAMALERNKNVSLQTRIEIKTKHVDPEKKE